MTHVKTTLVRLAGVGLACAALSACTQDDLSVASDAPPVSDTPLVSEAEAPAPASAARLGPPLGFTHEIDVEALRSQEPKTAPDGCLPIEAATTITAPGDYCVVRNIVADADNPSGLSIASDDVTVDLMGHSIVSLVPDTIVSGVASSGRSNITVRNGAVSGFLAGVWLRDGSDFVVSDMDLSGNQWRGVKANGARVTVSGSTVRSMEGHAGYPDSPPVAIDVAATDCEVSGNRYGAIRPIFWNDTTGIVAPDCTVASNTDEGQPEGFCIPVRRPATISRAGSYCLMADIDIDQADQDALNLSSDGIRLDLNGHAITGPGGDTLGSGVRSEGFENITVTGGTIGGFLFGVRLEDTSRSTVRDVTAIGNSMIGIRVRGDDSVVETNRVEDMSGLGGDFASSHTFGIEAAGANVVVRDNSTRNIYPYREGEGVGVGIADLSLDGQVIGNRIAWDGDAKYGKTLAIWLDTSPTGRRNADDEPISIDRVARNTIEGANYAFSGQQPLTLEGNTAAVTCGYWHGRRIGAVGTNTLTTTGSCPLDLDAVIAAARENPQDLGMQYRLADRYMTVQNYQSGLDIFEDICKRGFEEACRRLSRYEETGRTFD